MASIAIHSAERMNFPNYALMKISAWHKARGDSVEWWNPLIRYDKVYSSKIFTFTDDDPYLPDDAIKGGTGYGLYYDLPEEIDAMFPDYTIYGDRFDYAIGFLTRGCIRRCPWCVVPKKEGQIHRYRTWREVKRPGKRDMVLMDNNVLACDFGKAQIEELSRRNDVRVDFNQGLDARLITPDIARMLAKLRWMKLIRVACDTDAVLDTVLAKAELLRSFGIKPYRIMSFLLVQDIQSAERRAVALRSAGIEVFAQPYRDFENKTIPTKEQIDFARWVNCKAIFKTVRTFDEYNTRIRGKMVREEDK